MNLTRTFCNSESIEWGNDLSVAKYHLQASSASVGTVSEEPTEDGWKGITKSAGKIFDFPSESISNWISAGISIL